MFDNILCRKHRIVWILRFICINLPCIGRLRDLNSTYEDIKDEVNMHGPVNRVGACYTLSPKYLTMHGYHAHARAEGKHIVT